MDLLGKMVGETVSKDAFGEMISQSGTTPNEWRYEGEQYDQGSGLYDLRARWMDPGVGRFTSRDTFSGTQTDPVSLHPYLYAEADPVNRTDPSGHNSLSQYHGIFLSTLQNVWKGALSISIPQLLSSLNFTGRLFAELLIDENIVGYMKTQPDQVIQAMNAMVACVYNRGKYPREFEARGGSVLNILTAPDQFAEFTSNGLLTLKAQKQYTEKIAEARMPGEWVYYSFVTEALKIASLASSEVYRDPFLSRGGTYGWRTWHHPYKKGTKFLRLGVLAGNTFYTVSN
jgi:RHS repeat-associated protein